MSTTSFMADLQAELKMAGDELARMIKERDDALAETARVNANLTAITKQLDDALAENALITSDVKASISEQNEIIAAAGKAFGMTAPTKKAILERAAEVDRIKAVGPMDIFDEVGKYEVTRPLSALVNPWSRDEVACMFACIPESVKARRR